MGIQQIPLASSGLSASDLITEPSWSLLASTNANNVNSLTISGLSGYNKYRIYITNLLVTTANDRPGWYFNGDTSANKHYINWNESNRTIGTQILNYTSNTLGSYYYNSGLGWRTDGYNSFGYMDITNAKSTGHKFISQKLIYVDQSNYNVVNEGFGIYTGTSPISSITTGMIFGGNFYMNNVYVYGAN